MQGHTKKHRFDEKKICKIFNDNNLKIIREANKKTINFLDVTLDLNKDLYSPYTKPNNTILYVPKMSNHLPSIIKNIPASINKILSKLSSNKEQFDKAKQPYQTALDNSGYKHKLTFEPTANTKATQIKNETETEKII